MSGWDGDISKMGRLAENIGKLARISSQISTVVSYKIRQLIDDEFIAQCDPYGGAWEPLAQSTIEREGPHPILELSGSMHRSLEVLPMGGAGVSVYISHPGEDHQTGWSGTQGEGPARPVLPSGPLPPLWKEAIDDAVSERIISTMSGDK